MSATTSLRVFKLGVTNYLRNRGLSLSATLILTLTLLIVIVFVLLNAILADASAKIRSKIDLSITFDDSVEAAQIASLQKLLASRPETRDVALIDKDEALRRFQARPGVSERTKQLVTPDNNPLPRSLEIKANRPEDLIAISAFLEQPPWKDIIRRNSYLTNQGDIQKIGSYERGITLAGIALAVIFSIISLIVVVNTIRLAIFARREEIEIMRLVGANNIFIRMPFIIEAILYAVVASALALVLTWLLAKRADIVLTQIASGIDLDLPAVLAERLPFLIAVSFLVGLGVAIFASLISIQRYLRR